MTAQVASRFAVAFAEERRGGENKGNRLHFCLGRDGRPSGAELADAVAQALARQNCDVIDLDVVTTPTVGVMVDHFGADGAIVLTASHNPIEWDGVKCLQPPGVAPDAETAQRVINRFQKSEPVAESGVAGHVATDDSAVRVHLDRVLRQVDVEAIRARAFRVALDSVNGAGCVIGRVLLEELGCTVVHLNGEPTGVFAHTPEPIEANLTDLAHRAREEGCAIGFAQDPDADRLAIVDETGRYIGEEYTLVLAAKQLLDSRGGGAIAANLSTSRMIDDLAADYEGASVVRTPVGEANVAQAMQRENALCGGEGNGGVILPEVSLVRDSIGAMALVLNLCAREDRPLSAIVDHLPRYAMLKQKFDLTAVGGREAVARLLDRARTALPGARVNDVDGVRLDVEAGWVHVRPSNTEPIMRIIAESEGVDAAQTLVDTVARATGIVV